MIFNWRSNATHRTSGGEVYANVVGNCYINGPASSSSRFFSASGSGATFVYQQANHHDRDQDGAHDGFLVNTPEEIATGFVNFGSDDMINSDGAGTPYDFHSWVEEAVISALEAYARAIGPGGAGASLWRDVIDQRVIDQLQARAGTIINSQEVCRNELDVLPGIDDLPTITRPADWDTDGDSMPDEFENAYGLDPQDPADRNDFDLSAVRCTNLEVYLNALVAPLFPDEHLAGDYSNDGVVNAADCTLWRDHLGSNIPLLNEVVTAGSIDQADYDAWQANFGTTLSSRNGQVANAAVPEPASVSLVAWAGCLWLAVWLHRP